MVITVCLRHGARALCPRHARAFVNVCIKKLIENELKHDMSKFL